MKKRLVCFLIALALAAAMLPASALADGGVTDRIVTSYDPDNYLELTISGDTLTVSGRLRIEGLEIVTFRCNRIPEDIKVRSGEYFSHSLDLDFTEPAEVCVSYSTHDDIVRFDNEVHMTMHVYVFDKVYIERTDAGYRFMRSKVLDNNLALLGAYADPAKYCDASKVPASVKAKSDEIVAGISGDYEKVFALHKWVAENIYYDEDYFLHDHSRKVVYDSAGVLDARLTVCAGYAALLKDLILAQGIPAMEVTTLALGLGMPLKSYALGTDIGGELMEQAANHDHVEAYVDGRWVAMDPTWDSGNRYEYGTYETNKLNILAFYYFDISPEVMALDHKYLSRGDGNIKLVDGAVTGADSLPVKTAAPTSSTVLVNGAEVKFDAYNIGGSNYFKLRDLAYVLSGSEKQFEVTWNDEKREIELVSQSAYTPVGGELQQGGGGECEATLNISTIYLDGCVEPLTAYTINGSNYFKLRDLGSTFDFDVTWDGTRNTVIIDTTSSYTPD